MTTKVMVTSISCTNLKTMQLQKPQTTFPGPFTLYTTFSHEPEWLEKLAE